MKPFRLLLSLALLSLPGCVIAPAIPSWPGGPKGSLALDATDGLVIPAEINGQPVRLKVDTGYSGIILNPAAAARLHIGKSPFQNDLRVGPVKVDGETGTSRVTVGGITAERRMAWFERDVVPDADGIINIAALPYETTTVRLRPAGAGETPIRFETVPDGLWSVTSEHMIGGKKVAVHFLLLAPQSLFTASAGALVADQQGGTWAGAAVAYPLALGVTRPARPMTFARPLMLNGLAVGGALVRTSDFVGHYALPSDPDADPGEIVVTGKGGGSHARLDIILGRDNLAACSSITYESRTRLLTLQCRAH